MIDDLNKAQRLALAAAVAPRMRDPRTHARRVKLYDQETGETTKEMSLAEAQQGILRTLAIEIDVADGVRPKQVICVNCQRPVKVLGPKGAIPKVCQEGCDRGCTTEGCGGFVSMDHARRCARVGAPPKCRACRYTQRARVEKCRKGHLLAGDNVRLEGSARRCLSCEREKRRRRYEALCAQQGTTPTRRAPRRRRTEAAQACAQSSTSQGNIDD